MQIIVVRTRLQKLVPIKILQNFTDVNHPSECQKITILKSSTMMIRSRPSDIVNFTRFIRRKSSLSFQNPFPPEPMHLRIIYPQADQFRVEFFKGSARLRNFVRMYRRAPQESMAPQKGYHFICPKNMMTFCATSSIKSPMQFSVFLPETIDRNQPF